MITKEPKTAKFQRTITIPIILINQLSQYEDCVMYLCGLSIKKFYNKIHIRKRDIFI